IILLCFYYSQKTFFALSVLLMFCMFFTHQISVFASFIIIIGFFLGILFGRKLIIFLSKNTIIKVSHERVSHIFVYPNVIYTILWGVWFIVYFSITKYGNSDVFSTMIKAVSTRIKTMIQIFQSNEELVGTPYEALFQQYNFMDLILYNLGQNLLLCLAILGILLFLIYCINQYGISLIIAILSLFIVIYVGTFLGLGWILFPHRLLPFLQLLYIIFSAFGLYALYCSIPDKSKYLLVLITLLMVFFLITTPYINRDDTLYCEANEVRVQLTLSELTGIECGQKISPDKHIIVDQWVKTQYFSTIENTDIDRDKLSIYPDKEGLIYIRDYVVEKKIFPRPGRFGTSGFIDYSNYLMDIINKDVKIYDNKNVWIYKSN
ncbi:MAG: hypothetical protein KAW93_05340, partial [Methanogenium sp.]|nr:hypothetical protein [Methanogenium sp.]